MLDEDPFDECVKECVWEEGSWDYCEWKCEEEAKLENEDEDWDEYDEWEDEDDDWGEEW